MVLIHPLRLLALVAMILLMVLLGAFAYKMTQTVILRPMQAISTNAASCIQSPSTCSTSSNLP
jgi:hypothetical protein